MSFRGRVVAITGAASGIGRALAIDLAQRGADLALCDVSEDGLAETAAAVERTGRQVTTDRVDVSDRAAVYAWAEKVVADHGRVDGIVNNAGVSLTDTIEHLDYDDFEWIVGINFWGVVYGTKAFLPHLLERGDGWIVNVSSVFGIIAVPSQAAYNATKFAVRGFTECLRQELDGSGVSVSCVHPGGIKTNIARGGRFRRSSEGFETADDAADHFENALARTTAEEAGKVIADGMAAKAPRILIGADARLIDVVQRTMPVKYTTLVKKLAGRRR